MVGAASVVQSPVLYRDSGINLNIRMGQKPKMAHPNTE
jgi:hypothetical protein